jgi:hypothetical protein
MKDNCSAILPSTEINGKKILLISPFAMTHTVIVYLKTKIDFFAESA